MNTLDLAHKKVILKKVSGTNGGEWQGPCPACGGTDRFHVWPVQNDGNGAYWCRGCEKAGDNIQFLRDFEGMSFRAACAYLNVSIPDRPETGGSIPKQREKPEFKPDQHVAPADLWQEKAGKFVDWSQNSLQKNAEAIQWLSDRGISARAADDYRLGWNSGENGKDIYRARKSWGIAEAFKEDGRAKALWIPVGLVIPYIIDGIIYRIRIRRPDGEPRYYVIPGSSMATMTIERQRRAFVVVESELDAIAVASNNVMAGAVALGSVSAKPDAETYAVLQGALQVLNALDYDAAGAKAMAWWNEQFDNCDRWPVPQGKDPGEAYRMGISLDKWIEAGLPPALTIAGRESARKESKTATKQEKSDDNLPVADEKQNCPPEILELYMLLKKNPGVKIINSENRFAILRDGKYVGGRINELVYRVKVVMDYILSHPAEEIDGRNLLEGNK